MNLDFNFDLSAKYKSKSQIARVLTENWVLKEIYCPNCGETIHEYENNRPVADFFCKICFEDFELKAKVGKISNKVSAGSYSKMIERLDSNQKPNFFFMGYENHLWTVADFLVVPKHFFIPGIIEKRKALAVTARRAGWIGSNILFSHIPKAGQIFYIKNGLEVEKTIVLDNWRKTLFLKKVDNIESKSWILDVIKCIEDIGKQEFTLNEMYKFEHELALLHPKNSNIKPKIRQQLQLLRDQNFLSFTGEGSYRLR